METTQIITYKNKLGEEKTFSIGTSIEQTLGKTLNIIFKLEKRIDDLNNNLSTINNSLKNNQSNSIDKSSNFTESLDTIFDD